MGTGFNIIDAMVCGFKRPLFPPPYISCVLAGSPGSATIPPIPTAKLSAEKSTVTAYISDKHEMNNSNSNNSPQSSDDQLPTINEYQITEDNPTDATPYIIDVEPTGDFLQELEALGDRYVQLAAPVTSPRGLDPNLPIFPVPHIALPDYTETGSSSEASGQDDSEVELCILCSRRPQTVLFGSCSHSLCASCVKGIWWGRIRAPTHWPTSFPCPYCRKDVELLGRLTEGDLGGQKAESIVWKPVKEWMIAKSRKAAQRMNKPRGGTGGVFH